MLLLFTARPGQCAVRVENVVELIPSIPLLPISEAPDFVAGALIHRGEKMPVVDLSRRLGGESCEDLLSTRIIIVSSPAQPTIRLGLRAENVLDVTTDAAPRAESDSAASETMLTQAYVTPEGERIQVLQLAVLLDDRGLAELLPGKDSKGGPA